MNKIHKSRTKLLTITALLLTLTFSIAGSLADNLAGWRAQASGAVLSLPPLAATRAYQYLVSASGGPVVAPTTVMVAPTAVLANYAFSNGSLAPTSQNASVTASNINFTGSAASQYPAPGFPHLFLTVPAGATNATTAVSSNSYFQFTLTPNGTMSLTNLSFGVGGNNASGGVQKEGYVVRSSADGYVSNLASAIAPVQFSSLGTITVDLSAAAFQNRSSAVTFRIYGFINTSIPEERAPAIVFSDIKINGTVPAPEINLKGNGQTIFNNSSFPTTFNDTDFGSSVFGSGAVEKTFTIENLSGGPLNLTGPQQNPVQPLVALGGSDASSFSVTALPSTPIAVGNSTTFKIRFNPSTAGTKNASVTIVNDDVDECPYVFSIRAATCTNNAIVTTNADSGVGSLRQAIADACPGSTITFNLPANSTITLTSGELAISKNLTIQGPGANLLTISGNLQSRIFIISSTVISTITGLTIADGKNDSGGGGIFNGGGSLTIMNSTLSGNSSNSFGGSIYSNGGTLTITNSTLSGNSNTGGSGGAIYMFGGTQTITNSTFSSNSAGSGGAIFTFQGNLTISNSAFSGNSASTGGGIFNAGGALTITDSSFSANTATNGVGGIYNSAGFGTTTMTITNTTLSGNTGGAGAGGAIGNDGGFGTATLTITSSTLFGNSARLGAGIGNSPAFGTAALTITNSTLVNNSAIGFNNQGGGIYNINGMVKARNTIIAGNTAMSAPDFSGTLTSLGHNLIGNNKDAMITPITGDQIGTDMAPLDAKLSVHGNYGGPTQTLRPLPGSPAINAGNNCVLTANGCGTNDPLVALTTDQRGTGFNRQVGSAVDIGAVEVNYALAATSGTPQSAAVLTAFANPLVATLTESNLPVSSVPLTFVAPLSGASASFTGTNPVTTNASGEASVTATANATTGSYFVTVGANGLTPASFSLANTCPTITATVGGGGAICAGGGTTVTVTVSGGIAPYTVTLNNGGGTQTGNGPVFTFNVSPANTTTYGVQSATDANGCAVTATGSATVTVNQLPVANAGAAQIICQTLTTAGLGGNTPPFATTGTWTSNSGGSFSNASAPNATWTPPANFNGVATLTWTVTSTAGCGTTQTATVQVTVNGNPVAAVGGAQTIGVNQTSAPLGTGPLPFATTGQWTSNSGGTFSNANDPAATWTPPANYTGIALLTWAASSSVFPSCGAPQTGTVQVTVSCPVITFSPISLAAAPAGTAYSQQLTLTPSGSYSFSIILGSLPSGLTLNPTTGLISGLPSGTGTFNFTVKAQAANGCAVTQAYTLVLNCPTITLPGSITNPTINTAYSQTLAASPAGSYSYAVMAGALPAGLTLNAATGVISGTPTTGGAYSFTIRATRFSTCTGSQTYSGTISCPTIKLACPSCSTPGVLPDGRVNALYARSLAATPSATYTYSITAGALPPGLSLIGASLSGRPTAAGTYSFTVRAQGSGGCFGTQAYTLTVTPATLASKPNQTDFDGDGKSDIWSYRPQDGRWLIQRSSDNTIAFAQLGSPNEIAVPADYDGDGKTDAAVFNASKSRWQILQSSDGSMRQERFGTSDAQAFAADFDGDGKADLAVKSNHGDWQIKPSSGDEIIAFSFGYADDQAVLGDFDGDGLTDVAVYRASTGLAVIRHSGEGSLQEMQLAFATGTPLAADFDGDGTDEFACWSAEKGLLQYKRSSDQQDRQLTLKGQSLLLGDFDGDGLSDCAISQNTGWQMRLSSRFWE